MITTENNPFAYDVSCITQDENFAKFMGNDSKIKTTKIHFITKIAEFLSSDDFSKSFEDFAVNKNNEVRPVRVFMTRNSDTGNPKISITLIDETTQGGHGHESTV